MYFKLIEQISYPMSFEMHVFSKLSPAFNGNFLKILKYLKSNIDDWDNREYLPELVWGEELSDWLKSNSKI